jgi:hypothetical protein
MTPFELNGPHANGFAMWLETVGAVVVLQLDVKKALPGAELRTQRQAKPSLLEWADGAVYCVNLTCGPQQHSTKPEVEIANHSAHGCIIELQPNPPRAVSPHLQGERMRPFSRRFHG